MPKLSGIRKKDIMQASVILFSMMLPIITSHIE